MDLNKFTQKSLQGIQDANNECISNGNTQVEDVRDLLVLPDSDHDFVTTRKDE